MSEGRIPICVYMTQSYVEEDVGAVCRLGDQPRSEDTHDNKVKTHNFLFVKGLSEKKLYSKVTLIYVPSFRSSTNFKRFVLLKGLKKHFS